ncbi:related to signal recognition particle 9 protein (SRP9) [Melanopsichium pennsylvanicum]|uniref:Related to signal recognition particle 9 protein (SRP9) n=1 Tax=Melanopsichium pennsylvanicum TaxID=63383 RepID=A0AAJ4XJF8_9BASI|nr:related to signal recognition particle 9 protein (SRP9) [Melanopsichium pennsylvanicum]
MVYIKDWPEFQQRSIKLYQNNPHKTRYLIKSRPSIQSLTLKVTDDTITIKYRTKSSAILGRLEIFNKAMTFAMAGSSNPLQDANPESTPAPTPAATTTATATVIQATSGAENAKVTTTANGSAPAPASASASAVAAQPSGGASASDKKKKKKKGKK